MRTSMIEWRPMIRALGWFVSTPEVRVDIWKMGDGIWRWTVFNLTTGIYDAAGRSQDLEVGMEDALAAAKM